MLTTDESSGSQTFKFPHFVLLRCTHTGRSPSTMTMGFKRLIEVSALISYSTNPLPLPLLPQTTPSFVDLFFHHIASNLRRPPHSLRASLMQRILTGQRSSLLHSSSSALRSLLLMLLQRNAYGRNRHYESQQERRSWLPFRLVFLENLMSVMELRFSF